MSVDRAAARAAAIGVMGGTFDPIHHGHLVAASEVADRFGLDEVIFVPTGQPWQKSGESPAEHRYLMTVIATAANPRFTVSRVDIDRPGPTYTKDTLRDLRAAEPGAEWFFITGADALAAIMSWKDVDELFDAGALHRRDPARLRPARPGTAGRVGDPDRGSGAGDLVDRLPGSGSRAGAPVWYLVPDGVVQYIAKHRLYQRRFRNSRRDSRPATPMTTGSADTKESHDRTPRALELAQVAAQAAADKKAKDILLIDVSDRLAITDCFVIVTGTNERQVGAIVDAVEEKHARRPGAKPTAARGRTGRPLGAARLPRRRRARAARGGAGVLRPRPAVEGLPDDPVRRRRMTPTRDPAASESAVADGARR